MAAEDTRASTWRAFEHGTLANWCDTTNSVRHHPLFSVFLTPVQPPVLPSFWFCNAAVRKALLDFDSELKVWHKMMLEKAPPLLKQNPRQWLQQIFDNTQGVNSGKIWPLLTSQQALQCIDRAKWKHWPGNALTENWNVDPVLFQLFYFQQSRSKAAMASTHLKYSATMRPSALCDSNLCKGRSKCRWGASLSFVGLKG